MKKWILVLILGALSFALYRADDRARDGFSPSRIAAIFPDDPKWDIRVACYFFDPFPKSLKSAL